MLDRARPASPTEDRHRKPHHRYLPSATELLITRAKVAEALAEDAACRVPGVAAGVYGLSELAPFARLGHGLPMIRKMNLAKFDRAADNAEFRRRLRRAAPFLESFDLKHHGLCLAGGSVSALLMRPEADRGDLAGYHDYDLFLVGHPSDESAKEAIRALQHHLYEQWGGEGRVEVFRTKGCITFFCRDPRSACSAGAAGPAGAGAPADPDKDEYEAGLEALYGEEAPHVEGELLVQVVLRRYSTAPEVIHGFDLGSSAALWDGARVWVTALGKLAFENGANVLNLAARRSSYERRLSRYFDRGFDLVLPDLSGCSILGLEGRLPYLYAAGLSCRSGCACDLWAYGLCATKPDLDNYGRSPSSDAWGKPPEAASDYAAGSVAYGCRRRLAARNVRALSGETVWVESLCAGAVLTPELDIFGIEPALAPGDLADLVLWAFSQGKVNLKALVAYLGKEIAAALVLDFIGSSGCVPEREAVLGLATARCLALEPLARIPFAFMTVEAGTALTGPFPRCVLTPAEWYGEALALALGNARQGL